MTDLTELYKRLTLVLCASCAFTAGACGTDSPTVTVPGDAGGGIDAPPVDAAPPPPTVFSTRPSRSSTIAITDDDSIVAMVNPDEGTLSVFQTSDNSRISRTATGKNPSSVVIMGDGSTAYVANRDDGTVVRLTGIDGGKPKIDATVSVGAEPVGLALSPSGLQLFVAEFAESRISIIDTQSMEVVDKIPFDRPRALVVTNNGDQSEADEVLVASHYYGQPVAGKEAKDDGRTGLIVSWPLNSIHTATKIVLAPFTLNDPRLSSTTTSPNQLAAMAVNGGRVYVTSVSASPEPPTKFNGNVFPVVYVADLATGTEVTDATGTANLVSKVKDLFPGTTQSAAHPMFLPGDLSDIAFVDNTGIGYTVGKAGDVMIRLVYTSTGLTVGAAANSVIDLLSASDGSGTCQAPIGLVVSKKLNGAYVNCWITRRLGFVDFGGQVLKTTVEASALPANTDTTAQSILRGKRFYFTGRARWSAIEANGAKGGEGWSSCGSCHPDGLTDNITWVFPAGPRQTTSMDGSFSHGAGDQKERIFNWTAVNDELHDFEANVRNVSGGLGVITTGKGVPTGNPPVTPPADCPTNPTLDQELAVTINAAMGDSNKDLADSATVANIATCKHKDWDDITAFVQTITPVHAAKTVDASAVAHGRDLFTTGQCAKCHGGAGWTISRRPYDPKGGAATALQSQPFTPNISVAPFAFGERSQISFQPVIAGTGGAAVVPVLQLACALRNVSTFGVPGDTTTTTSLERRQVTANPLALDTAEGAAGYNVPSLYGVALGAPYLHHGQSPTLQDLFSNQQWAAHTNAGNPNFSTFNLADSGAVDDLVQFLLSIDASTPEFAIPTGFDACP